MVIYRSFFEAIKEIPKASQAEVWNAVFELGFNFQDSELTGISKTVFTLIKPQILANIRKYKNGAKPKQNGSKTEARNKQNGSKTEGNVNDNVNDNEKIHNDIFRSMWKAQIWVESICMKFDSIPDDVRAHIDNFRKECILKADLKANEKEAKNHFINWIKVGNPIPKGKVIKPVNDF